MHHQTAYLYAYSLKHPDTRFYAISNSREIDTSAFQNSLIDDVIKHWVFDWCIKPLESENKHET